MQSDYNPVEEPSWLADSIDLSAYQCQEQKEPDQAQQSSFSMMSHNDESLPASAAAAASGHSPNSDHNEVTRFPSHCYLVTLATSFASMQALLTCHAYYGLHQLSLCGACS